MTISIPDEVNFLSRPIRVDSYVEHVVSSKDHRRMNKVSTTCLLNDSAHVAGLLNDSAHVAAKVYVCSFLSLFHLKLIFAPDLASRSFLSKLVY